MRSFDTKEGAREPRPARRIAGRLISHPESLALVIGGAALAAIATLVALVGPF